MLWSIATHCSSRIFCDSRAALLGINDRFNRHPIATDIRNKISEYSKHICLNWVKGHIGTAGNERADHLAKCAANSNMEYYYSKCPISHIKELFRKDLLEQWNNEWLNSNNGRLTKELFFPSVLQRLKCKFTAPSFVTTQFLSGHGKFGNYLERFRLGNNICICEHSDQTVPHLLLECPAFEIRRFELILHLDKCNKTFHPPFTDILSQKCCYREFNDFLNYIHKNL